MIKTLHVHNYSGTLDEAVAQVLEENGITEENLVDIKYAVRTPHIIMPEDHARQENIQIVDRWFSSVFIVWKV